MAQEAIDSRVTPLPAESRPLEQCIGQILRQDVYAERDNPPFDRVCMDGIAIASAALGSGLRRFTIESIQAAGAPAIALSRAENAIEVMIRLSVKRFERGSGAVESEGILTILRLVRPSAVPEEMHEIGRYHRHPNQAHNLSDSI